MMMRMMTIEFFNISIKSFNLISIMLGMFIGGMMTRVRALGVVCVYLALLVTLVMILNNNYVINYLNLN